MSDMAQLSDLAAKWERIANEQEPLAVDNPHIQGVVKTLQHCATDLRTILDQ